jgi:hypothetical protein
LHLNHYCHNPCLTSSLAKGLVCLLFLCQRLSTATSSPADDVHHYPKVTRFYFQQTSGIHAPVGKRKGCSLSGRSPAPIADSFHVATMARKQRIKYTRN